MKTFRNRVVAVTGAASGIGQALAIDLAERGARLAISDVDEVGLEQTLQRCEAAGAEVHARHLDVREREELEAWPAQIEEHFGDVHAVINNAGVAIVGTIDELPLEVFEHVIDINFWGVVHGTRAFLPYLKRAEEGHVVNISSIFGIIGVAGQGPYNASKFAVKGFSECLKQELDMLAPHVKVTCVHPGGIKTNIARAASFVGEALGGGDHARFARRFDRMAQTTPERAAEVILAGVLRDQPRVLVGPDAKLLDLAQRVAPATYHGIVMRSLGGFFKK